MTPTSCGNGLSTKKDRYFSPDKSFRRNTIPVKKDPKQHGVFLVFIFTPPKTNMTMERSNHEWRCISYQNWWFSIAMLVFWRVLVPLQIFRYFQLQLTKNHQLALGKPERPAAWRADSPAADNTFRSWKFPKNSRFQQNTQNGIYSWKLKMGIHLFLWDVYWGHSLIKPW